MSKASEFAKQDRPIRPVFANGIAEHVYVQDDGRLFLMGVFEPSQAVPLARWILDVFGEFGDDK